MVSKTHVGKPVDVQELMRKLRRLRFLKLKPERVQDPSELAAVDGEAPTAWRIFDGGTALQWAQRFPSSTVALLYSAFVSGLGAAREVPVSVRVDRTKVTLVLRSRTRDGRRGAVTDEQLDFAATLG